MHFFRFARVEALYLLIPLLAVLVWLRIRNHQPFRYRYTLTSALRARGFVASVWYQRLFFLLRFVPLVILVLLIARPQLVDVSSTVKVEGIDIALVLDVSDSMSLPFQGGGNDLRSRFAVAKEEAIHFIEQREHDAIALVLFGNGAVSRCPLTLDKRVLRQIIEEVELGKVVDAEGTTLFTAMVTAANRLKQSKSKSKLMVLLTDGTPMREITDPKLALEVTKQMGIRVHTVGIGGEGALFHPLYGPLPGVDRQLLDTIARETGGLSFLAHNAKDMRRIYEEIDRLERTEQEMPVFSSYRELFQPFAAVALGCIFLEIFLSACVWLIL